MFLSFQQTVTEPNNKNPRKLTNSKPWTAEGITGKYRNIKMHHVSNLLSVDKWNNSQN